MNYRHAYHAGNFADVLKHVSLVLALEYLNRKDAPWFYLDTHSGRGNYPLTAGETQRAGEYRDGIARLLEGAPAGAGIVADRSAGAAADDAAAAPPPSVSPYLDLVRRLGVEDGQLVAYPGSPKFAQACMRENDRAALCELERGETSALRAEFRADARIAVHGRDGYEALRALLPPREKRGLVLIDPPYEQPDEFDTLHTALTGALQRWPVGTFAVWYPIKHGDAATRFIARMAATGVRRQLVAEICVRPDDSPVGLNGAGMLLVNPPWQLDRQLSEAVPWLHRRLVATLPGAAPGRWHVDWSVPE